MFPNFKPPLGYHSRPSGPSPQATTSRLQLPPQIPKTQRAQIPLTHLDQQDGTTGPSLIPDWSFFASPATVTFTIFFFFFIEREILGGGEVGWREAPVTAGVESGGYSRPGYSQLGERGQVEPDK